MFKKTKDSSNQVGWLKSTAWLNRILMVLATISLVDFLVNGTYYKLLVTGGFVLILFVVSKFFKSLDKSFKFAVHLFKLSSWFERIVIILALNSMVDLVTTFAFYKLLALGCVMFLIVKYIKHTALYTVVSSFIVKLFTKNRKDTAK